ncbi:MAG: FapA family protein [Lachnospiraceae bacterium]|jgi:uncharacterized protein (DUF342 family)|nr:FapA family protein [Lachnospiraceae bacterium]
MDTLLENVFEEVDAATEQSFLPRMEVNGSYVRVTPDSMEAWLFVMPPSASEGKYKVTELETYLGSQEVLFGYHGSNLQAICQKGVYQREILVARGLLPVNGHDGYFEYTFNTEEKVPEIKEDGTVDYSAVNRIDNVRIGDKLATYHKAKSGVTGSDVKGNSLAPASVKDIPPLRGAHVSSRDTDDTYFAEREGKVELRDGKIDIQNIHEVFTDVDLTIGKIEFFGDIIINGNVETGVVIRAGRNIEVRGSVEAASLFAGGDIILQRGIQGQQRGRVSARGSVFAKFIEQTIINAGGDVTADSIMNSRIHAEGKVILSGKRGMLLGGYTHALLGVSAATIGNDAEARTVVHAGCEAEVIEKGISLKKREVQVRNMLEALVDELNDLREKASVYGDKQDKMLEITAAKIIPQEKELKEELAVLLDEQVEIQTMIKKGKGASIRVDGNIYQGTVICISQLQMPIETNTMFMEYTIQGGMIVGAVIIR